MMFFNCLIHCLTSRYSRKFVIKNATILSVFFGLLYLQDHRNKKYNKIDEEKFISINDEACKPVSCDETSLSFVMSVGRGDGDVSYMCFNNNKLFKAYTSDMIFFVLVNSLNLQVINITQLYVPSDDLSDLVIPGISTNQFFFVMTSLFSNMKRLDKILMKWFNYKLNNLQVQPVKHYSIALIGLKLKYGEFHIKLLNISSSPTSTSHFLPQSLTRNATTTAWKYVPNDILEGCIPYFTGYVECDPPKNCGDKYHHHHHHHQYEYNDRHGDVGAAGVSFHMISGYFALYQSIIICYNQSIITLPDLKSSKLSFLLIINDVTLKIEDMLKFSIHSEGLEVSNYLKNITTNKIILFASESYNMSLNSEISEQLEMFGSSMIHEFSLNGSFLMVGQKGLYKGSALEKLKKYYHPDPIQMKGCLTRYGVGELRYISSSQSTSSTCNFIKANNKFIINNNINNNNDINNNNINNNNINNINNNNNNINNNINNNNNNINNINNINNNNINNNINNNNNIKSINNDDISSSKNNINDYNINGNIKITNTNKSVYDNNFTNINDNVKIIHNIDATDQSFLIDGNVNDVESNKNNNNYINNNNLNNYDNNDNNNCNNNNNNINNNNNDINNDNNYDININNNDINNSNSNKVSQEIIINSDILHPNFKRIIFYTLIYNSTMNGNFKIVTFNMTSKFPKTNAVSEAMPLVKSASSNCPIAIQCDGNSFALRVFTGVQNVVAPIVCVDGILLKANLFGRGLNFIIYNPHSNRVIRTAQFDSYLSDVDDVAIKFLSNVQPEELVIVFTHDDAATRLQQKLKSGLMKLGSYYIDQLQVRNAWLMIGRLNLILYTPYEFIKYPIHGTSHWSEPINFKRCVNKTFEGTFKSNLASPDMRRLNFCIKCKFINGLCSGLNSWQNFNEINLQNSYMATDHTIFNIPIILFISDDMKIALDQLESLFFVAGLRRSNVHVLIRPDPVMQELLVHHKFNALLLRSLQLSEIQYATSYIWQKYPDAVDVIVIEKGVMVTKHYLEYLAYLYNLYRYDDHLCCVDSYNPYGFYGVSSWRSDLMYRTNDQHGPSLAYMAKKSYLQSLIQMKEKRPNYDKLYPDVSVVVVHPLHNNHHYLQHQSNNHPTSKSSLNAFPTTFNDNLTTTSSSSSSSPSSSSTLTSTTSLSYKNLILAFAKGLLRPPTGSTESYVPRSQKVDSDNYDNNNVISNIPLQDDISQTLQSSSDSFIGTSLLDPPISTKLFDLDQLVPSYSQGFLYPPSNLYDLIGQHYDQSLKSLIKSAVNIDSSFILSNCFNSQSMLKEGVNYCIVYKQVESSTDANESLRRLLFCFNLIKYGKPHYITGTYKSLFRFTYSQNTQIFLIGSKSIYMKFIEES